MRERLGVLFCFWFFTSMIWHGVLLSPFLGFPIVGRLADSVFSKPRERLAAYGGNRGREGEETSVRFALFLELHKYHRSRELSHTVRSHIPEYETFLLLSQFQLLHHPFILSISFTLTQQLTK